MTDARACRMQPTDAGSCTQVFELEGTSSPPAMLAAFLSLAGSCSLGPTTNPYGVGLGIALLGWAGVCAAYALSNKQHVVVGTDGLLLSQRATRRRRLPFGEIASVTREGTDVVVTLRSGEVLRLSRLSAGFLRASSRAVAAAGRAADAMVQRVSEARALYDASSHDDGALARLARGDQGPTEWLAALRRLGEELGSYREGALERERLWSVVESETTPRALRLAAAIALHGAPGREAWTDDLLARVGDRSAFPELPRGVRVVLEGSQGEIEALLASFSRAEEG